jgi:hypothetical protein
VWDVNTGRQSRVIDNESFFNWGVSSDGRYCSAQISTGSRAEPRRDVVILEIESGQEIARLPIDPYSHLRGVAFLPEKNPVLSFIGVRGLQLWSLKTGKLVKRFSRIRSDRIALSHNEQLALSAHSKDYHVRGLGDLTVDRAVRLWDLKTEQELCRFSGHRGGVYAMAFSPDDKYAVTGCDYGQIRLWKLPE